MLLIGLVNHRLAAFFGALLSTLILGGLSIFLFERGYFIGVGSGAVTGFLLGIIVIVRRTGVSAVLPNWECIPALSWRLGWRVFLLLSGVGITGIALVVWVILLRQRLGASTYLWRQYLFLSLLPVIGVWLLYLLGRQRKE